MFLILYLISIKTQEMCDTVVSEDPSLIIYCLDKYKTQRMYDEAVDDCLAVLKFVFDWFVAGEMITKLFISLYADENILYFNEAFGDAVFNWNGMSILNIDLKNINLDNNFDEDNPDSIILIRFCAWRNKFEKCKELKKELHEELMLVVWHPNRQWDWCMSEDEKKEMDLMFIDEL